MRNRVRGKDRNRDRTEKAISKVAALPPHTLSPLGQELQLLITKMAQELKRREELKKELKRRQEASDGEAKDEEPSDKAFEKAVENKHLDSVS